MTKQKYSKEVRERVVRMVREHQPDHPLEWATIQSVAASLAARRRRYILATQGTGGDWPARRPDSQRT
jgi:hypothetical protein